MKLFASSEFVLAIVEIWCISDFVFASLSTDLSCMDILLDFKGPLSV